MRSMTNNEKILQAVLLDDKLMEFGGYTAEDIAKKSNLSKLYNLTK